MSQTHYSWRKYQPGDEDAINALYFQITGRQRSREQWAWQWQKAPAGPGDIFLIEATHPDGRVDLIGHHGIMPVRFTCGDQDLLFGKTENTMVLPEYRSKILYPRFEMRFAKEYEPRYHALFSTMGPAAAIRQRQALGYTAENNWISLEQAYAPWGSLARVAGHPRFSFMRHLMGVVLRPDIQGSLPEGVTLLSSEEARNESFLSDYWPQAQCAWGVAPSRAKEDLTWRYWDNPYSRHYAVIVRQPGKGSALVIVEHHAPGVASIEDFSADSPDAKLLEYAFHAAIKAVRKCLRARLIHCGVVSDALPIGVLPALQVKASPSLVSRLRKTSDLASQAYMPRKLTARGVAAGLPTSPWNATMAISEGRR